MFFELELQVCQSVEFLPLKKSCLRSKVIDMSVGVNY